jgi:hypothetical protein
VESKETSAATEAEAFADRLESLHALLAPQVPDLDPDDLTLILHSILRPLGTGRRFILRRAGDAFVF